MCAMKQTDPIAPSRPRGNAEQAIAFVRAARQNEQPPLRLPEAEAYIRKVFELAPRAGLDPAIIVAQAVHETGVFFEEKSWGVRLNPAGLGITGNAAEDELSHTWPNGTESAISHVAHVYLYAVGDLAASSVPELTPGVDPRYQAFMDAGLTPGFARTIDNFTGIWGVDPNYARDLVARGNAIFPNLAASDGVVHPPVSGGAQVIVKAGHRDIGEPSLGEGNGGGGVNNLTGALERDLTARYARAYVDALRAAGHTVRFVQEEDGDDLPDSSRLTRSQLVVRAAELADQMPGNNLVLLDLHLEDSGAPGVFAIVPNNRQRNGNPLSNAFLDDIWENNRADVELARDISHQIRDKTGISLRQNIREPGVMSETETGVAAIPARLATFNLTARLRQRMIRLVIEHGDIDQDWPRVNDQTYIRQCAEAATEAISARFPPLLNNVDVDPSLLAKWFGSVQDGGATVVYKETDPVSKLWRSLHRMPRLERVQHFDVRTYYRFRDGTVIWRPNDAAPFQLMTQPAAGKRYPEGMDKGIAARWFSKQAIGAETIKYVEGTPVSELWLQRDRFPRLAAIEEQGARRYLRFSDGSVLWRPDSTAAMRFMAPSTQSGQLPDGMDLALANAWFGSVQAGGTRFEFNPAGPLSNLWLRLGRFPKLGQVKFSGAKTYFRFSDGSVAWRPDANAPVRWL